MKWRFEGCRYNGNVIKSESGPPQQFPCIPEAILQVCPSVLKRINTNGLMTIELEAPSNTSLPRALGGVGSQSARAGGSFSFLLNYSASLVPLWILKELAPFSIEMFHQSTKVSFGSNCNEANSIMQHQEDTPCPFVS